MTLSKLLLATWVLGWTTSGAGAEVVRFQIERREAFAEGRSFGRSGPYEILKGRIHAAVDPAQGPNRIITDLALAPRNAAGRVEYWADFFLLKPSDPARGNRRLLYDVHNRGNKLALSTFNEGEASNDPRTAAHAGNGFLMEAGFSVLWTGWDGDVVEDGAQRLLAGLPVAVSRDGGPVTGRVQVEITVDEPVRSRPFYWSPWGVSAAYPPLSLDNRDAVLTMRPAPSQPAVEIPRRSWAFARWENGQAVPAPDELYIEEGFRPGWLYQLVYTARDPRVSGLGLAGIRDAVSFLRHAPGEAEGGGNPLAGMIDYAYAFGISQSGRLINHFLHDGFNLDEAERPVFDGTLIHVAGSGRGLFNRRFGIATVYSNARQAHHFPVDAFPFATVPQSDPVTGRRGDAFAKLRRAGALPKTFFVQTSTEYWSRAASLLHTDVEGTKDLSLDPQVRVYLVAGAQHLGGGPPTPGVCRQARNVLNDRPPVLRALLTALDRWVSLGQEPPPSRYPRLEDGSLVDLETFRKQFPAIPGVAAPTARYQPLRLELGARWESEGVADQIPPGIGSPYRTLVPAVDADGNELAGIRLPDVAVPKATYTGWNLRSAQYGAEGQLCSLDGSWLPFAATPEERRRNGDPRPSLSERYATHQDYLAAYAAAVLDLWNQGYLLEADALKMLQSALPGKGGEGLN